MQPRTHAEEQLTNRIMTEVTAWRGMLAGSKFLATMLLVAGIHSISGAAERQPLTIRDAFKTTRFMVADTDGKQSVAISPNGLRYAAMLIRGDIPRDGVEVEIISGGLRSLEDAIPYSVARLFTRGHGSTMLGEGGEAPELLLPPVNFPIWIDNSRVAFLWDDKNGVRQVAAANVDTREWSFLTASATDVTSFGMGGKNTLVYEAKRPFSLERSNQLFRDGFTVTNPEAYSLLKGVVDGSSNQDVGWGLGDKYAQVGYSSATATRKIQMNDGHPSIYQLTWPSIRPAVSPDGRFAVIAGTPEDVPKAWHHYEGDTLQMILRGWDNRSYGSGRQLQQMFIASIEDASARPLLNAPMHPSRSATLRWAADNRRVVVWPVYLPLDSQDHGGISGKALAEVDVLTGEYIAFPISVDDRTVIKDAHWRDPETVELEFENRRVIFHKRGKQWVELEPTDEPAKPTTVGVEVRQNPNSPPALYALDQRSGRAVKVFDPNPHLSAKFSLGEVRFIEWTDKDGNLRKGRLFLPVGYRLNSQKYPLVIQTRIWGSREDFTLYGQGNPSPTLGPMFSVHLAQPLANQGIAVLQLGPRPAADSLPEAKGWMRAIETAIDHLSEMGIIDPERVGIMGHSRAGWHVGYTLAFSNHRFAAAIVDDNIDSGYVEAAFMGWLGMDDRRNGTAQPFGYGMKDWLENAPSFNVEHIRSPILMMVTDSFVGRAAPLVMQWEMFSRLRHLNKPVELWVAPNIEHGSHNLQNPTQLLAQQERAMDWWLYWLKDERDPSAEKQKQYAEWDRLQSLRNEDARRPAPPRLHWTAEPLSR